MTNETALAQLLSWWRTVTNSRRSAQLGRFAIGHFEVEPYMLALREAWSRYGPGIMNLCQPHRERLHQDALSAIDDVCDWLDFIESTVTAAHAGDDRLCHETCDWVAKWRANLQSIAEDPLAEPFGLTFGPSPDSNLLTAFRWWGDGAATPQGPGGPLSDLPHYVAKACEDFLGQPSMHASGLGVVWSMAMAAFPESVRELQFRQANSPWTAGFVLNWLLSDRGILRPSRLSPTFIGPDAVPSARLWLDQMDVAFRDWHSAICSGPINSAYLQLACPVVPSAYVVAPGDEPMAIRGPDGRVLTGLTAAQGQCCVFEFLLHRVSMLERRSGATLDDTRRVTRLVIVDGERRGRFAVEVENRVDKRPLSKGAAALLFALGRDGEKSHVPARDLMNLRQVVSEVCPVLDAGKKVKNHYTYCRAPALRGQITWNASAPQPRA